MMRQLANETDRVDNDGLPRHLMDDLLRLRVERREKLVDGQHFAARQAIEERRLSGVRVADERNGECGLARLPLRSSVLLDLPQVFLEPRDARAHDATIELELSLTDAAPRTTTRTSGAAASGLPFEVRPRPRQSRQHVLELRELDLRTRLTRSRATREDVENQSASVDD